MEDEKLGSAQWADSNEVSNSQRYKKGSIWLGRTTPENVPIGTKDDRHVCLVAGPRSGKGTSTIVTNLTTWPGSVFVVDPTGEQATLTANRRGQGLNNTSTARKVHVLDPYRVSDVQDEYRAQFNPLDTLDLDSKSLISDVDVIVEALIPFTNDSEAWAQNGARRLLYGVILYVITHPSFEPCKNLVTVRNLITQGDIAGLKSLHGRGKAKNLTSHDLLWLNLKNSNALNGEVAAAGIEFSNMTQNAPGQWTGVLDVLLSALKFINKPEMQHVLSDSTFSLADLKSDKNGQSIYVTITSKTRAEDFRWLRLMISMTLIKMEEVRTPCECGHPLLIVLDEFASLQRMERIEFGFAEIAKFDVKIVIALQNLAQLKNIYKENWETFISGSGTKIFFGIEDQFTREYVSKLCGDKEIVRTTKNSSTGESSMDSKSTSKSDGKSEQTSTGESKGNNYKRGILGLRGIMGFFRKLTGNSHANDSEHFSELFGKSSQETHAEANSTGNQSTSGESETPHKRPLITPEEVGKRLRRIDDRNDPLYPGLAIGFAASHPDPILYRRTNYFDFTDFNPLEGTFTPYSGTPSFHRIGIGKVPFIPKTFIEKLGLFLRIPIAVRIAAESADVDYADNNVYAFAFDETRVLATCDCQVAINVWNIDTGSSIKRIESSDTVYAASTLKASEDLEYCIFGNSDTLFFAKLNDSSAVKVLGNGVVESETLRLCGTDAFVLCNSQVYMMVEVKPEDYRSPEYITLKYIDLTWSDDDFLIKDAVAYQFSQELEFDCKILTSIDTELPLRLIIFGQPANYDVDVIKPIYLVEPSTGRIIKEMEVRSLQRVIIDAQTNNIIVYSDELAIYDKLLNLIVSIGVEKPTLRTYKSDLGVTIEYSVGHLDSICVSPCSGYLALSKGSGSRLEILNSANLELEKTIRLKFKYIDDLAWSKSGKFIAIVGPYTDERNSTLVVLEEISGLKIIEKQIGRVHERSIKLMEWRSVAQIDKLYFLDDCTHLEVITFGKEGITT